MTKEIADKDMCICFWQSSDAWIGGHHLSSYLWLRRNRIFLFFVYYWTYCFKATTFSSSVLEFVCCHIIPWPRKKNGRERIYLLIYFEVMVPYRRNCVCVCMNSRQVSGSRNGCRGPKWVLIAWLAFHELFSLPIKSMGGTCPQISALPYQWPIKKNVK